MGSKRTIALAFGLFFFWLLCISILRNNLDLNVRLFNDDYDRSVYALRGEWYLNGQVPYRDTISEYPQVPTYLFAFPYILYHRDMTQSIGYWLYSSQFSFLTLCLLFGTITLLYQMLPKRQWLALLMLLPAPLYFTYNRFDILPAFLCLLSLFLLQKQRLIWSMIVLGIATMSKWYPALLLPVYLSYTFSLRRSIDWRMILTFFLTCLVIAAPTLLAGGVKAFLTPYLFHAGRNLETISLPALLFGAMQNWFGVVTIRSIWIDIFVVFQILVAPFSFFDRIDNYDKVLYWNILIVACFMLFARIYSPQWLLWLMPMLILTARTRLDIVWIVFYGIATYIGFPVVWDAGNMVALQLMGFVNIVTIAHIAVLAFHRAHVHFTIKHLVKTT